MNDGNCCKNCPLVKELRAQVEVLTKANEALKQQILADKLKEASQEDENQMLTHRVNMNSSNSSRPPSTDGFKKPITKSLRKKSDLKQGGQPGHVGHNIILPHEPDNKVEHYPDKCSDCPNFQKCKSKSIFSCAENRYVVDVVISTKVTEHCIMKADCDKTDSQNTSDRSLKGTFPEDIKAYIQYGNSLTTFVSLLTTYGFMSYGRITKLIRDMTGLTISTGTAISMVSKCASKVAPSLEEIRRRLLASNVINTDETGLHINGKNDWVHNTSNSECLLQTVDHKRGREGINHHGIMEEYTGVAVHDCFRPYFSYGSGHALCCAHLLRELNGIKDLYPKHSWPELFSCFLVSLNRAKNFVIDKGGTCFDDARIERILLRYDSILDIADNECPSKVNGNTHAMKIERALIKRLRKHKDEVCHFVRNFEVPFDNNQAERDVRYIKVKMKVSGQFRDLEHTQKFLDIISYTGTARKNGVSAFTALTAAFEGNTDIIFG